MRACIALFAPVVCAGVALTVSSGVLPDSMVEAATECRTKPGAPPSEGKHWYYSTDRANNRRCWYLADRGEKVHRPPRFAPPQRAAATPEPPAATPERATVAPKARSQRTIEDIVKDLNAETPATAGAAAADAPSRALAADQLLRSGIERVERQATATSGTATTGTTSGTATSGTVSDEPVTAEPGQGGPLVWPKLATAEPATSGQALPLSEQPTVGEQSSASEPAPAAMPSSAETIEEPPASSGTSWFVLMLVFAAFVGAAFAYHRAAARRVARRLELERKLVAGSEIMTHPPAPATFAAEVGHWADIARRQPLPGDERFHDTEDAVRALLRASRARHHHEQAA
jgi:hypothetical protein